MCGMVLSWYDVSRQQEFSDSLTPNRTTIIIYEVYNCPKPHSVTSDYNSYNSIILICLILVTDTALES